MRFVFLAVVAALFAEETVTTHSLQLEQSFLSYTATVGSLSTKKQNEEVAGDIHYVSYAQEGTGRPLTFIFNGGPGSSSVWLHLGMLGPRRIVSPEEGQSVAPPYELRDNLETLLDQSDLVFVDPIGTGLSRAKTAEDAASFYDSLGDVHSLGDFIRDFLTANKRWNSPLYLAGESYGALRCCGLADYLQNEHGIYLNGLILISAAIDYQTFVFDDDNLLPYPLYLPTYVATAWHHGRYPTNATLEQVAEEARQFANDFYFPALLHPSRTDWEALYGQLSSLTGLPLDIVKRASGRIDSDLFCTEFFPGERKALGRFDTRITGYYTNPSLTSFIQDPSSTLISGIFSTALHKYIESELESPASYMIFSLNVNQQWQYRSYSYLGHPNFMEGLRRALITNPELKIFVGMGYFDAATPFASVEYCLEHLNLPNSFYQNIQKGYYEGGHMYYLNPTARIQFRQDLKQFYAQ